MYSLCRVTAYQCTLDQLLHNIFELGEELFLAVDFLGEEPEQPANKGGVVHRHS